MSQPAGSTSDDGPPVCEPSWAYAPQAARGDSTFIAELGSGRTREDAMDRAWERTTAAYARIVSAWVKDDRQYVLRHGGEAGVDSTVERVFKSKSMASGIMPVRLGLICEVPEGYAVWRQYSASMRDLLRRLKEHDPLARGIDETSLRPNSPARP